MPKECNVEKTKQKCNCTYEPCARKGLCCECIAYHNSHDELPACVFPQAAERTYDRSVGHFVRIKSR